MEAITVYVCPQCLMAFTTKPINHTPPPTRALCMGVPVAGTWVPEAAFPVVISPEGMVDRLKWGEVLPSWLFTATAPATVKPAVPDDDRQTVVKPKDGDDRYFDDEQEKLGR